MSGQRHMQADRLVGSGDGNRGDGRVSRLIESFGGSASHAAVVASSFPNWMARGHGADDVENMQIKRDLRAFYKPRVRVVPIDHDANCAFEELARVINDYNMTNAEQYFQ